MTSRLLVYKVVRTCLPENSTDTVNYLCKDDYVHIRLNKYGHKVQTIAGFEQKLTFLITNLILENLYAMLDKTDFEKARDKDTYLEVFNKVINELHQNKLYKIIEEAISTRFLDFKGIKILPMYSRSQKPKSAFDLFGSCTLPVFTFPLLAKGVRDTVYGFLFDDMLEIRIEEPSMKIDNTKFINKHKNDKEGFSLWN